jgi:hypothetical protein
MRKVNERTKEWIWRPQRDFGDDPQTTGDEGIDFIVWKEMPDNRVGKLFILGQCACGDDWSTKFNDLNLGKINKWFQPLCYAQPPVRAFTTPHHLSDMSLVNAQTQAGIVFDRARLALIGEAFYSDPELVKWHPQIEELVAMIIR